MGLTKGQKSGTKLAGFGFVCAMVWGGQGGGGGALSLVHQSR